MGLFEFDRPSAFPLIGFLALSEAIAFPVQSVLFPLPSMPNDRNKARGNRPRKKATGLFPVALIDLFAIES